jgi:hypothetical protein
MENYTKQSGQMPTETANKTMLTGMFRDRESAENAYKTLHERGYDKSHVNVVMSDATRDKHFKHTEVKTELGTKALEGTGTGSAIGGAVGAIAGAIAAIGTTLLIPGLGLVIAGPIAAALAGAGAGSITGGLIGALIGAGIPEERAKQYEQGIKDGHIVMGVHPRSEEDAKHIESEWRKYSAKEVYR